MEINGYKVKFRYSDLQTKYHVRTAFVLAVSMSSAVALIEELYTLPNDTSTLMIDSCVEANDFYVTQDVAIATTKHYKKVTP